ncbi:hypothetical protein [Aureimonas jatrophae]|uniref:Uncharacterized protein n=1 Tax=Aureimonas jatrophae TaxID=1166073 RepID=A0A1H0M2Q4_9HYPH|nr:hypothetical protein [Aureimonas jatrophae]MBB3952648.1 hypothetical protein [Aureimonas jatrophae]SDO74687.1 hypothetical protein SAMN05192530_11244 [Aureimonas jatrophae]
MLRDETDPVRRDIFIGELAFNNEQRRLSRVVGRAVATRTGWQPLPGDRLPLEGHAFSTDPRLFGKRPGYVVLFTVARNERPDARDRFVTDDVCEPYEYVERLTRHTPEMLREVVLERGIDLGHQNDGAVVVPVGPDLVALPPIVRSAQTGRWTLSHAAEAEAVETFRNEFRRNDLFEIAGRRFVLPGRVPDVPTGAVNWQNDAEFLQAVLRRLRRNGDFGSGSEDFRLTERLATRLFSLYRDADAIGGRTQALLAARARLEEFVPKLSNGSGAVAAIADALHSHDGVRKALVALTEAERAELRRREGEAVRAETVQAVETEIGERIALRDDLGREAERVETLVASRSERLAEIEASIARATSLLEGRVATFVGEVREAGRLVANVLGSDDAGSVSAAGVGRVAGLAPWARADRPAPVTSIGIPDLATVLTARAKSLGLEADVFRTLDIHCRSGDVPVLTGDSVVTILRGYADVIAGGRLVRQPLDPSVLGPEDLWRHPGSGQPTALAAAWQQADAAPSKFLLVALDDLDRASLSDWLPAFRTAFREARPRNLLVVATTALPNSSDREVGDRHRRPLPGTSGGSNALVAALMRVGTGRTTELEPVPSLPPISADVRAVLLSLALAEGVSGADAGERLLTLHAAATAWGDDETACRLAVGCLTGRNARAALVVQPTPTNENARTGT